MGEVSAEYETLFTPVDYAFAIWGVIYLMLILFVAVALHGFKNRKTSPFKKLKRGEI